MKFMEERRTFAPMEPSGPDTSGFPNPRVTPVDFNTCKQIAKTLQKGNRVGILNVARALGSDVEPFHILETVRLADRQKRIEWKALLGHRDVELDVYENIVSILQEAAKNGPREITYKELWNIALARDSKNPRPKSRFALIGYLRNHPKLPESLGLTIKPQEVSKKPSASVTTPPRAIESSQSSAQFTLSVHPSRQLAELVSIIQKLGESSEAISKSSVSTQQPGLTIKHIADTIQLQSGATVSPDFIRSLLDRMRREQPAAFQSIKNYITDF